MKNTGRLFVPTLVGIYGFGFVSVPMALAHGKKFVDGIEIRGVNSNYTVRVNMLANLDALLNIVANFAELAGITCGVFLMITVCKLWIPNRKLAIFRLKLAVIFIVTGLSSPGTINFLVASARDANLFS